MKIRGKVVFQGHAATHNQATLEGAQTLAAMLIGTEISRITNCFVVTAENPGTIPADTPVMDFNWSNLSPVLRGSEIYAVVDVSAEAFGNMTVTSAPLGNDGISAQVVCKINFPANTGNLSVQGTQPIFLLVLVTGGNTSPNQGPYSQTGSEKVFAVLDLRDAPLTFDPTSDTRFTWTIYLTPVQE